MEIGALLRPRPRHILLMRVGTFLLLAAASWSIWFAHDHYRRAELMMTQLRQLQSKRKPIAPPRPNRASLDMQRHWAALRTEQSFDWYTVFHALERANNPEIELLEFLPDKAGRRIVLRGEARTQEALIAYTSALSIQTAFSELYLANQKLVRITGMDVQTFEIRAVIAD
jgi:hypothetical protein